MIQHRANWLYSMLILFFRLITKQTTTNTWNYNDEISRILCCFRLIRLEGISLTSTQQKYQNHHMWFQRESIIDTLQNSQLNTTNWCVNEKFHWSVRLRSKNNLLFIEIMTLFLFCYFCIKLFWICDFFLVFPIH